MKQRFYTLLPYALAAAPVFVLDHLIRHFGMWGEYIGVADFGRSFFSTVLYFLCIPLIRSVPLCAKIMNALDSFLPMLLTKAEEKPCGQRMFFFYRRPSFYFLTVCFLMLLCWLPRFPSC